MPTKQVKTVTAQKGRSIVDVFPPELLLEVTKHARFEDLLCLKLSCKAFNACLPDSLNDISQRAHDSSWGRSEKIVRAHLHAEKGRRKQQVESMICTRCSKVKPRDMFEDDEAQARPRLTQYRWSPERYCLPCSFWHGEITGKTNESIVTVKGVDKFRCRHCGAFHELSDQVAVAPTKAPREVLTYILGPQALFVLCTSCADSKKWKYKARGDGKGYLRVSEVTLRWGHDEECEPLIITHDRAVLDHHHY